MSRLQLLQAGTHLSHRSTWAIVHRRARQCFQCPWKRPSQESLPQTSTWGHSVWWASVFIFRSRCWRGCFIWRTYMGRDRPACCRAEGGGNVMCLPSHPQPIKLWPLCRGELRIRASLWTSIWNSQFPYHHRWTCEVWIDYLWPFQTWVFHRWCA